MRYEKKERRIEREGGRDGKRKRERGGGRKGQRERQSK